MNTAEYNHYHRYQDMMDALEEKFQEMKIQAFKDLLNNHDEMAEAIGELAYDSDFIEKIALCLDKEDCLDIGRIFDKAIRDFLWDRADEITTDRCE